MEDKHYDTLHETEKYHWWYSVRRKIVHKLIATHVTKKQDIKLLDVGCGTGELLNELTNLGEVFGIDSSQKAVDFCHDIGLKNVTVAQGGEIPFPDKFFDIILCLDVLEHIKDDEKAIKEISRAVKPGGLIIIFVPTFKFLWGKTDEISHHFRRYRLSELQTKTEHNGLRTIRSSYFNFFLFLPILLTRWLVKVFKISIESENRTGDGVVNKMLFWIFSLESVLLRYVNFPFGVSGLLVLQKPLE